MQNTEIKALVIGGTGMLGKPVVSALAEAGHHVRVFTRNPEQAAERSEVACELAQGDIENKDSLKHALEGCNAVHLSINGAGDWDLERRGAETVAVLAKEAGLQRISLISGASVSPENAWFPMIKAKLAAEKAVMDSGVPYSIFRCTMFMESLSKFLHGGKAIVMGKQPHRWHWTAADDYAGMVVRALTLPEAANRIFHVRGPEALTMEEALEIYRKIVSPRATLTHAPFWLMQIMAFMPGGRQLRREGLPLMRYFSKAQEEGDPTEANSLLGTPTTTVEAWASEHLGISEGNP